MSKEKPLSWGDWCKQTDTKIAPMGGRALDAGYQKYLEDNEFTDQIVNIEVQFPKPLMDIFADVLRKHCPREIAAWNAIEMLETEGGPSSTDYCSETIGSMFVEI